MTLTTTKVLLLSVKAAQQTEYRQTRPQLILFPALPPCLLPRRHDTIPVQTAIFVTQSPGFARGLDKLSEM